jgi:Fic family protein
VNGNAVRFPAREAAADSLNKTAEFIRHQCHTHPELMAITGMLSVFTNHPLKDGNGRVGRVLFNHLMQETMGTLLSTAL